MQNTLYSEAMLDISEAVISGAVLTGVDYSLNLNKGSSAITNGAILAGSDLLIQMLASGDREGVIRYFVYKQHEPLSVSVLYAAVQEAMRLFGARGIYSAEWKAILGNIFLASGASALGIELNKAFGLAPNVVSAFDAVAIAAGSVAGVSKSSVPAGKNVGGSSIRSVMM